MKISDIYLYIILAAFVVVVAVSLWRFQRDPDNKFDILDLLIENNRVSRLAFGFCVTLVVTSWLMLKLAIDGKLTEGYLGIYGALWVTPIVTKMFATSPPASRPRRAPRKDES